MITFLDALIAGIGLGGVYALIAVGFVIIFRATGVLNFAQPVFMIFGTYVSYLVASRFGLPFPVAVVCAVLAGAAVAMATERVAMRPMIGRPPFAAALVTVGLFAAGLVVTTKLIGHNVINSGDPWGLSNFCVGGQRRADGTTIAGMPAPCVDGVTVNYTDIAKIVVAVVTIGALGWWLGRSRYGLAMRATAMDQEVAQAQGIRAGSVFAVSWGIAGGLAALAGVLIGMAPGGVSALAALIALKALPAIILGGLDSVKGAVIGGVVIGVVETMTKVYQPGAAPWLGANFDIVMPYLVMLIVLMIRPYGIFGTKEVQRV
ncbi:branched-chain amino acid ABC transporter permease [Rhodococcus triatomae]|uniref:Branched-chain amino acid transport system permease protein n=1 Tax=Rhodococcus triatomae TaxID=300028 RepID=A0A1G8MSQ1_9NOCA|nr:branched-chain amino acid ABC transporter permease [Rhodococcus triatomae]QNG19077.1 branched-chain amino acid ABC transporter permease [Rhodococcus triatomae]QNG25010.1 branched-chain amino acid ABC transporter permease [Rhodococcus triatomae]SDI70883.1 branched-chain amino acid transport system permease protein [Rhodococcus triatomae]